MSYFKLPWRGPTLNKQIAEIKNRTNDFELL